MKNHWRDTPVSLFVLLLAWLFTSATFAADTSRVPFIAPPLDSIRSVSPTPPAPAMMALPPALTAPSVRLIQPATVSAGQTLELTLHGAGLGTRAQVRFGAGIEVLGSPQALGESQLRLQVRVAADAVPGPRMPRVTNGNLSGSGPASLMVLAAPTRVEVPALLGPGSGTTDAVRVPARPVPGSTATPPARTAVPTTPVPVPVAPGLPTMPATAPPLFAPPAALPLPGFVAPQPAKRVQPPVVKLAFGKLVPDTKKPAWDGTEKIFDESSALTRLVWQTTKPSAYQWRWQIASQPFPSDPGVQPPALLNEGDAYFDYFNVDLAPYLPPISAPAKVAPAKKLPPTKPPAKPTDATVLKESTPAVIDTKQVLQALPTPFHIRLIALQGGKPTGLVSNTVIAHYQQGSSKPDPALFQAYYEAEAEKKKAQQLAAQAKQLFDLKILSFQPAIFPDPNRWGCVKVVSNPYAGQVMHPLGGYGPGEHCPKTDPSTQQKGWFDKYVVGSVEGWALAWNKLSGYYNGAKAWVATQVASKVPCDWLGEKVEKECQGAVEQMVGAAISAGLAVVGLPPSLPNLDALSEAGKGKLADAAVEFSCQTFESNGGTCTPAIREQLKKYYQQGMDELQKQLSAQMKHESKEPGCGDKVTAGEYGRLPLPCFTDYTGVVVHPATGSVYEPPRVKVRVTRKKPQPPNIKGCDNVAVNLDMKNHFKGGMLSGKTLPPADVAGPAYLPVSSAVPTLAPGKSVDIVLEFAKMAVVEVPGNHYGQFYLPNWLVLYRGGTGTLSASMLAAADTGKAYGQAYGSCAPGDSWPIQIPQ